MKRDIDQLEAEEAASGPPPAKKHRGSADSAGDITRDRNKDVFPFFQLACELRDLIYDEMLERKTTKIDTGVALMGFTISIQPRHTQICRRFHQEAMERAEGVSELKLVDLELYCFESPHLAHLGHQIRTLHLFLAGCNEDLRSHENWLQRLMGDLPNVTEICVSINTHSGDGQHLLDGLRSSKFWSNIGALRQLSAYEDCGPLEGDPLEKDRDERYFDFSGSYHILYGRWNAATRAYEKAEAKQSVSDGTGGAETNV